MDVLNKPIQERIDWLLDHASRHANAFSSPESFLARKRYTAEHPTAILVLKCMDGRINIPSGIIQSNMQAGRIPDDGFLLLASVPYAEIGVDRSRAELKSRFLSQFATDVISAEFPELASKMLRRTTVLDWRSRELEVKLLRQSRRLIG